MSTAGAWSSRGSTPRGPLSPRSPPTDPGAQSPASVASAFSNLTLRDDHHPHLGGFDTRSSQMGSRGPSGYPSPMPHPQPPPNNKYMNDFGKALSWEMHILLEEVGKLRDEHRQLQYEIDELKQIKARFGGGVDLSPAPPPEPEAEPAPPPPASVLGDAPAPPAWRIVPPKREERRRKPKAIAAPPPEPASQPASPPRQPLLPTWAHWKPSEFYSPTPRGAAPPPVVASPAPPPRSGLFGPPTPPPR